jgi:hypothetical protein
MTPVQLFPFTEAHGEVTLQWSPRWAGEAPGLWAGSMILNLPPILSFYFPKSASRLWSLAGEETNFSSALWNPSLGKLPSKILLLGWRYGSSGLLSKLEALSSSSSTTKKTLQNRNQNTTVSETWWRTSIIPALRKLRAGGSSVCSQPRLHSKTLKKPKQTRNSNKKLSQMSPQYVPEPSYSEGWDSRIALSLSSRPACTT